MKGLRQLTAVAALFVAAATGPVLAQAEPGVTDDSITIGLFSPLSGKGMAYGFDVVNAAKMWYEQITKDGGIHGRKIKLDIEDTRYNANDLVAAVSSEEHTPQLPPLMPNSYAALCLKKKQRI